MTKNLESADRILKLALAFTVILCYLFGIISGPMGVVLLVLSSAVVLFFVARMLFGWISMD
jgi:pilus assembly protein TadC